MEYKAKSITAKAASACKMNMGLVMGASDMHNATSFVDHGALTEERIRSGGGGVSIPDEEEKEDKTNKTKD